MAKGSISTLGTFKITIGVLTTHIQTSVAKRKTEKLYIFIKENFSNVDLVLRTIIPQYNHLFV